MVLVAFGCTCLIFLAVQDAAIPRSVPFTLPNIDDRVSQVVVEKIEFAVRAGPWLAFASFVVEFKCNWNYFGYHGSARAAVERNDTLVFRGSDFNDQHMKLVVFAPELDADSTHPGTMVWYVSKLGAKAKFCRVFEEVVSYAEMWMNVVFVITWIALTLALWVSAHFLCRKSKQQ